MNNIRVGRFTSSEIYNLMTLAKDGKSFGKPAITYIRTKNNERGLLRSIDKNVSARPTSWGKVLEALAFEKLSLNYKLSSQETITDSKIDCWAGSPDGFFTDGDKKGVYDIKCPYTLNSFVDLVNCRTGADLKENFPEYYWQLVSNAILTDSELCELIIYCPYKDELENVKEAVDNYDGNPNEVAWINFSMDEDLPYLLREGKYKDLNVIRFDLSKEDKQLLISTIIRASKELIPYHTNEMSNKWIPPTEEQKQNAQKKIREMLRLKSNMQRVSA